MGKGMKQPPPKKDWRYYSPDEAEIKLQKRSLADYIVVHELEEDFPKPSMATYKAVLPHLAELDAKWKQVNALNFKQKRYTAFRCVCDRWRHLLESKQELTVLIANAKEDQEQDYGVEEPSDADEEDGESEEEQQQPVMPARGRYRGARNDMAGTSTRLEDPDLYIASRSAADLTEAAASDGSRLLAITDGQKIARLGELHRDMETKVAAAKGAIKLWWDAKKGMPYLDAPTINTMQFYGK